MDGLEEDELTKQRNGKVSEKDRPHRAKQCRVFGYPKTMEKGCMKMGRFFDTQKRWRRRRKRGRETQPQRSEV